MAVAVFDYGQWALLFPELAEGGVTEPVATAFFGIAELLLDNTDCSPVANVNTRLTMLNYATAHLASLGGYPLTPGSTVPVPREFVGRVSSATEGTVSVSTQWAASVSDSEAWWIQTPYGALFWQLTRALRTMRYVPAPPRNFSPGFGFRRPF